MVPNEGLSFNSKQNIKAGKVKPNCHILLESEGSDERCLRTVAIFWGSQNSNLNALATGRGRGTRILGPASEGGSAVVSGCKVARTGAQPPTPRRPPDEGCAGMGLDAIVLRG